MPRTVAQEAAWLAKNPDFKERPATLIEFLGPTHLNIEDGVRESIKIELSNIIGKDVGTTKPTVRQLAMITGGIGIGKTTIASIVLPYLVHWCLCLRDPQKFFGLLPGSRIAFMQMSTSEQQAKEVVFGDIKARINHSPWFKNHPPDPKFTNQFRFEPDIWILPGDSAETTFEGYNILGGILDEADSHKVTKKQCYATQGFETIFNRMSSRFEDRGFLLVIGQMKSSTGFAATKFKELTDDPDAYAVRMSIWDSRGDDYYRCKLRSPHPENPTLAVHGYCGQVHKFAYDTHRKRLIPLEIARTLGFSNAHLLWIPEVYRLQFTTNPEKALKDLAGLPPAVGQPFISLVHKIHDARDRWVDGYHNGDRWVDGHGPDAPVDVEGRIAKWFKAYETLERAVHIDIAYAAEGDAMGIAMGHVPFMIEQGDERKPYISIDFLMRLVAPAGGEISLAQMRHVIYDLKDHYSFKMKGVTLDGFQSQDTIQQFNKKRLRAEYLSIDRQVLPYHDLREAIYEDRIDFPPYMVVMRPGQTEITEVLVKELTELVDAGAKIDHPALGSKDVADAVAGVTFTLMGDRRYHKKVQDLGTFRRLKEEDQGQRPTAGGLSHPAYLGDRGLTAPLPPASSMGWR